MSDQADRVGADPTEPDASPVPDRTLAGRTVTAAQWKLASSLVTGVLQFGVSVVLARLLTPTDFGLVALALIVVGFAEMVVDLGFGPAVVQREELTERHIRVSFTASTIVGLTLAILLVAIAPVFALLLKNEAVPTLLRWQALIFVFSGTTATARALLQRTLDFRGLFVIDLASYLVGYALVAVTLAFLDFGAWSLVIGALVQGAVACVVALRQVPHPLQPLFARHEFRDLFGYGFGVILNRSVVYAAQNGDYFVVGRWLGAAPLGLYSRAFQLMQLPLSHLSSVTWSVLFSTYSRLQSDPRRAASAYLKGVQLNALIAAPIMAGMIVAGPHLVTGLFGARWIEATLPLQILCGVGVLRSIYGATGALTHAFGAVYAEFRRQIAYAALVVLGALAGLRWGIHGVAIGTALSVIFMYFAMAKLGMSITGCRWRDFFGAQLTGFLLAAGVSAAALVVRLALESQGAGSGAILATIIITCIATVPLMLYLMPRALRPVELFRVLSPSVARLPAAVQLPIRRIMHLSPEQLHAPS